MARKIDFKRSRDPENRNIEKPGQNRVRRENVPRDLAIRVGQIGCWQEPVIRHSMVFENRDREKLGRLRVTAPDVAKSDEKDRQGHEKHGSAAQEMQLPGLFPEPDSLRGEATRERSGGIVLRLRK